MTDIEYEAWQQMKAISKAFSEDLITEREFNTQLDKIVAETLETIGFSVISGYYTRLKTCFDW